MDASLSPAEERGLHGLSLDSRVRRAFFAIPPQVIAELVEQMTSEALQRKLVYMRDGRADPIRVLLRPTGVMPDQLGYLHFVSLTLINALKRLPDLYIQDFNVRSITPITPAEEKWLWDTWGPSHRDLNPVFGRLDAVLDFTSPMWKDSLHFIEPNLSGVGGLYFVPTCEQMLAELVLPMLMQYEPALHMEVGQDLRELFMQEMFDHLEAIGRPGRSVCFLEPKYAGDGPAEQEALVEYFRDQHGLTILHADPSELYVKKGEVWYEDSQVDVAYRDYEVRDLMTLETQHGVDIRPLRLLFQQNRIISSMAGDFDHKSCWELLTDSQFTQKYFNAEERQVFRRHVLWTRLLTDRRTTLPDGETGDLRIHPPRTRHARPQTESLRWRRQSAYWAVGEHHGMGNHSTARRVWRRPVVVQRLTRIPASEFPALSPEGAVHTEPFYTVIGLTPTKYGVSILGRASQKMVVNVAQRGGMYAMLIGEPSWRLSGPR